MSWSLEGGGSSREQSNKTLTRVSFPGVPAAGCLPNLAWPWSRVLFVPLLPQSGDFFFVLFLASCFLSPPCVLAGARFCGRWPKGMFWSCQEGRRLGSANPWMIGAPSSLSLAAVLRSWEELPRPDPAFPPHVSWVRPVPPLPSAAYISFVTTRSPGTDCRRRGRGWGSRRQKSRLPRFWFQFPSQVPGTRGPHSARRQEATMQTILNRVVFIKSKYALKSFIAKGYKAFARVCRP